MGSYSEGKKWKSNPNRKIIGDMGETAVPSQMQELKEGGQPVDLFTPGTTERGQRPTPPRADFAPPDRTRVDIPELPLKPLPGQPIRNPQESLENKRYQDVTRDADVARDWHTIQSEILGGSGESISYEEFKEMRRKNEVPYFENLETDPRQVDVPGQADELTHSLVQDKPNPVMENQPMGELELMEKMEAEKLRRMRKELNLPYTVEDYPDLSEKERTQRNARIFMRRRKKAEKDEIDKRSSISRQRRRNRQAILNSPETKRRERDQRAIDRDLRASERRGRKRRAERRSTNPLAESERSYQGRIQRDRGRIRGDEIVSRESRSRQRRRRNAR